MSPVFTVLCFLTVPAVWPTASRDAFHAVMDFTLNCEPKIKGFLPQIAFWQDILITPARKVTNTFVRIKPKIHKQSLGAGMHPGRGSGVIWTPTLSLHGASFSLNTHKTSLSETQELFLSITSKISMANGVQLSPSGFDVWACSSGLFI